MFFHGEHPLSEICVMESFNGTYQEWSGAEKQPISLMVLEEYVQIGFIGSNTRIRWKYSEFSPALSFDSSQTELRHLTGPGRIEVAGRFAFERIQHRQQKQELVWYARPKAKEWIRNGSLLIGLVVAVLLIYSLIVPFLAEKLASTVSVETEQQLGDGVYEALSSGYRIDTARTRLVSDFFVAMKVPSAYSIRIAVVNSGELNAFALPGGRIVVYSALLDKMKSAPELAALLAHEFTHVDRRHATRSIFRKLGSQVFLGLVFGKVGTVSGVLVDHADELRSLTYSRSLEKEADLKGLKILTDRGIDPTGFVDLFDRLGEGGSEGSMPEFLASHPDLQSRTGYIKESSKGVQIKSQPVLDTIFAQLKP